MDRRVSSPRNADEAQQRAAAQDEARHERAIQDRANACDWEMSYLDGPWPDC